MKFADELKLRGMVNVEEEGIIIKEDLDNLVKQSIRNSMKLNSVEFKAK